MIRDNKPETSILEETRDLTKRKQYLLLIDANELTHQSTRSANAEIPGRMNKILPKEQNLWLTTEPILMHASWRITIKLPP